MPVTLRSSTRQPANELGTRSSSLNGPRRTASRLVGTMAWPATAAPHINAAAMAARRLSLASCMLGYRLVARREPAQAAVGQDDEHQRRHEQHQSGKAMQEALP